MRFFLIGILFIQSALHVEAQDDIKWSDMIILHNEKNINSSYNEFSPALWNNNILYLSSSPSRQNKDGYFDIFLTAETGGYLKQGVPLSSRINSPYHEGPVCYNGSDRTLYFTRVDYNNAQFGFNKKQEVPLQIFYSSYNAGQWTKPKKLEFFDNSTPVCHPSISSDGTMMIFAADVDGGYGKMDLYSSKLIEGEWTNPTNLGSSINSEGNDWFPFLDENGFLFYSSDRAQGHLDLYVSRETDSLWQESIPLPEPMNSQLDDFGISISKRGTVGYISSNRPGGKGDDDIYNFNSLISLYTVLDQGLNKLTLLIKDENDEAVSDAVITYRTIDINTLDKIDDSAFDTSQGNYKTKKSDKNGSSDIFLKGNHTMIIITKENKETEKFIVSNITASGEQKVVLKNKIKPVQAEPQIIYKEIERPRLNNIEVKKGAIIVLENIYYEYNDHQLTNAAKTELAKLVQLMQNNPRVKIELSSHTDSRGKAAYNLELSQKRAQAAKGFMTNKGIASSRIMTRGYGETKIRNHCSDGVSCSESEHIYNRRTEIKVIE